MKKIVVTGGSGKAGRATVAELVAHGYEVLNVDLTPPAIEISDFLTADLQQLGETIEALEGADAVVHLAANPNPNGWTEQRMFQHNTMTTYNIFRAAMVLKLKRVVWASSETILGLPFDEEPPHYVPMDEVHAPLPNTSYALSKVVSEEMARQFHRWTGIPFVGLRFSNVMEPNDYYTFPTYWDDPYKRKWNLWGYIDARDVAQSCRLALEAKAEGAEAYIIAAADTVMNRPSRELMAAVFPDVPIRDGLGEFETLLSIEKARRELGFDPAHSWRQHLNQD